MKVTLKSKTTWKERVPGIFGESVERQADKQCISYQARIEKSRSKQK